MIDRIIDYISNSLRKITFWGFLLAVAGGVTLILLGRLKNLSEIIQFFGFVLTVCSILVAAIRIQYAAFVFRANHDWNRRQLAILQANDIRLRMQDDIRVLNKEFEYYRRRPQETISVEEIHIAICRKDDNGNFERDSEGKLVVDYDGPGVTVKNALYNVLNSYEFIAGGVYQGVFDKDMIYTLFGGIIIKAYSVFEDYIEHQNVDMHPERNGKIWICLKQLGSEFVEMENDERAKAPKKEKTG